MGQKILGLDLGAYSTKGVLIERNWQDFVVLDYFERINESDPALNPHQQQSYHLQKFLEEHPLPADTAVIAAMPGYGVQYRFFELPFTNQKKIDQAMEFELENYIPFDIEKVWFDYHTMKTDKSMSNILCAYTQIEDFKNFLAIMLQNNLNPRQIGADAVDLACLAHVAMLPQEGQYALIDYGHQKTSIVIVDGDRVRYIRTLAMGSRDITRKIAAQFDISEHEADRLKCEKGQLSSSLEEESPLAKIIAEIVRDWIVNIRQTFAAYTQGGREYHVQAIYLFGGGSKLSGLQSMLASSLKMNVATLDCLAFTPHHIPDAESIQLTFPQAFATGLKALHWPKQPQINFRKGEFAYRGDIEGLQSGVKKAAMWIAAILGAAILHYQVSHYLLSGKVKSVRAQAKEVLGKEWSQMTSGKGFSLNSALSIVSGKTAELQEKLNTIAGGADEMSPLFVLREISANLPKKEELKLNVDNLNITEEVVRMEGKVASFEAADIIKQSLSKSPHFFNLESSSGKGIKDEIKFSLNFSLKEKKTQ